jgi:uncharacterized LabA/DUF88 family protein
MYHGWHRERRPTHKRLEFEKYLTKQNVERTIGIVSFTPEFKYGNDLACASDRSPLYDTSRPQGQKMVDTAIACDALFLLKEGQTRTVVIVSDDDDFAPVLFTAEAWGLDVVILRFEQRDFRNITDIPTCEGLKFWATN